MNFGTKDGPPATPGRPGTNGTMVSKDRFGKGCNTVWKCFKRVAWRSPNQKFIGFRKKVQAQSTIFGQFQYRS